MLVFLCKQKTAYEMRISDWSSDVCSSDLLGPATPSPRHPSGRTRPRRLDRRGRGCNRRTFSALLVDRRDRLAGAHAGRSALERQPASSAWPVAALADLLGWTDPFTDPRRSEERCGGKGCVRKVRSRWAPYHKKKK